MIHLAFPRNGVILDPGERPEVACGDAFAEHWCTSPKRVDCPKCREIMLRDSDSGSGAVEP